MPGTLTTYKVFIASAGGLDEFREAFRDIVSRYNTSEAHHRGYMFMPIGWEETITGHGRPQAMINKDLRQCDFALFMFRNRWGTPPDEKGPHTSGTAEEWEIANELQKKRSMRDIQGCFFPNHACNNQEEMDQRKQVEAFKQKLIAEKRFFFKSLKADSEFHDWLRSILSEWLRGIEEEARQRAELKEQFFGRKHFKQSTAPEKDSSTFSLLRKKLFSLINENQFAAALAISQVLKEISVRPIDSAQMLLTEGLIQRQLTGSEAAIATYGEVILRFGDATEPEIREQVATTLVCIALAQGQLKQHEAAIAACDEVVRRYGDASEPALQEQVAIALVYKGITQHELKHNEAEISTYDEVIRRFGDASELALREQVMKALITKGVTQSSLHQSEAAIATYDEVVRRFDDAPEPALRNHVAIALIKKSFSLGKLKKREEIIATCDEVVHRFGDAAEPGLREQVAWALFYKGTTHGGLKQSEKETATYYELIRRFGDMTESALNVPLTYAFNGAGFNHLLQAKAMGLQAPMARESLRTALKNLNQAFERADQPNGMVLGNLAYIRYLLGETLQAETDFAAGLRASKNGGQSLYEGTLNDLDMHPIPEDQGMRELVERAWVAYQREQPAKGGATP